jgi:molybdopterin-guanine dinucleotide biosynthesis protein B
LKIIAVMGGKNSGKTRTATFLIRELVSAGYRVASVKHIHHSFTMDSQGKDTWRMRESGAEIVASISPNEVAILRKPDSSESDLERVLEFYDSEGIDVTVAEGFQDILKQREDVVKILTVNDVGEVDRYVERVKPDIIVYTGVGVYRADIPAFSLENEGGKLVSLLVERFGKGRRSRDNGGTPQA